MRKAEELFEYAFAQEQSNWSRTVSSRFSYCDLACLSYRFSLWAVLFVLGRLLTLILSVLTVGFGLARAENQKLDFSTGNFNVLAVRYSDFTVHCAECAASLSLSAVLSEG